MVLEMKIRHGDRWKKLPPVTSAFLTYGLTLLCVGIYRNNHHTSAKFQR
jgi:uncharacterized membrane protein